MAQKTKKRTDQKLPLKVKKVSTKKKLIYTEKKAYPPVDQVKIKELVETVREYSIGHEIANAVTHGIGGGLSIAGLSVLVMMAATYGNVWRVVSSAIYGATLVMLYLASTLYHGIHHEGAKRVFKTIDHAAIYLLIAGTYTPFTLVSLREKSDWGWTLFGIIWTLAIIGVVLKAFFPRKMSTLSVFVYILMGWMCLFAIGDIRRAIGFGGMVWLVAGGLSYTIGVIFYAWNKLPFNHAIWHLFVLSGSICHFFAILFYVIDLPK